MAFGPSEFIVHLVAPQRRRSEMKPRFREMKGEESGMKLLRREHLPSLPLFPLLRRGERIARKKISRFEPLKRRKPDALQTLREMREPHSGAKRLECVELAPAF